MSICPHCQQKISTDAVTCPYCRTSLKAYGHQGIPVYYAEQTEYLCDRCIYHQDDTCTFPQRPFAKTCTLYLDKLPETNTTPLRPKFSLSTFKIWCDRHKGLLLLSSLILISLILAIF